MTEDEAKDRWCPFSGKTDTQNMSPTWPHYHCLGSNCMMWRWQEIIWTQGQDINTIPHNPIGYCGLAGKP